MRGGTSKGLYFHATDLPEEVTLRNQVLLAAMGSPDQRQIDGLGGAHPLTSKVAIISPSQESDIDVDYLFLQVQVDEAVVSDGQNCGNILAGVAPFAIENNLVIARDDETEVRIRMINSGAIAVARVQTPNKEVTYQGDAEIDGVPGSAAPIMLDFKDVAGSTCGALFPTSNLTDSVDGVEVTCIDNGMPVVIMNAASFGKTGYETPSELESDLVFKERIEAIRLKLGPQMNLGDVTDKTIPKMTLLAPPVKGGSISTRSLIPHRVHDAIGVLGATGVAAACLIPGTVANASASIEASLNAQVVNIEHPTGSFSVEIEISTQSGEFVVNRSALLRTARKLMQGTVFVPSSLFDKTENNL